MTRPVPWTCISARNASKQRVSYIKTDEKEKKRKVGRFVLEFRARVGAMARVGVKC